MTNNILNLDNGYYKLLSTFNVVFVAHCSFYLSNSCSDPGRPMVIFTYKNGDTSAHTVDYFKSVVQGKVDPPDNDNNESIDESIERQDKEFKDMGIDPDNYEEGEGAMTVGKLFKDFTLPPKQGACRAMMSMFRSDVSVANFHFKVNDYRRLIYDAADPVDYEVIIPGYVLAVNSEGHLNVDCPCPETGNPEIITPAIGADKRTLQDCFVLALNGWWMDNGEDKHYPGVHPCWYETIEQCRTSDKDTEIAKPVIYAPAGHSEWMDKFHEQWGMYLIPNTERSGQSVWIIRRKDRNRLAPCFTVVKFDENRWDIAFYDQEADVIKDAIQAGNNIYDAMYKQSDPNNLFLCVDFEDIYRINALEDAPPFIIEDDTFESLNNCEARGEEHDWRWEGQEERRGGVWVNSSTCEKCNVSRDQIVEEESS